VSSLGIEPLDLHGLNVVQRNRIGDSRGFLSRVFCREELAACGWREPVAQINHTFTQHRGTVRGLHFQSPPFAEMKLVSCIRGEVWDVAVDIRANSPTFMQWRAQVLSADNRRALLIPKGFAHGFQAFTDDVELIYCHSASWDAASEGIISAKDPRLAITWPLPITTMSARDAAARYVEADFKGIAL
jgi:dTDP-4-dehydrorhamnose 3,5-epimerase